jgi:hypothetical protein
MENEDLKYIEKEHQDFQEQPTSEGDKASTLIALGGLFLVSNLVGLAMTGFGHFKWGSAPFLWWYAIATVLGLTCIISGVRIKHKANTKADS